MRTKHHLRNRSRGGKDHNNIVMLPDWWHRGWHDLMGDLTTEEAVVFIRKLLVPNKKWGTEELKRLRDSCRIQND